MKNEWKNYIALIGIFLIWSACTTENLDDPLPMQNEDSELDTDGIFLLENDEVAEFLRKNPSNQNKLIAQIRQATVKYHDFYAAIDDGYMLEHCVQHPTLGGMGHHVVHMGKIGPFVNATEPGVLLYEPMKNGKMKLVGVEYIVPAGPWDNNPENDGPPMLGDVQFDDHRAMTVDENGDPVNVKGGPPIPHYQLHAWIWKANPSGMYTPFNPNVSCQHTGS